MIKEPKIKNLPKVEKEPKADSLNYKIMKPAWRIASLDIDGKWGYNSIRDIVSFYQSEELIELLINTNNSDLGKLLDEIEGRKNLSLGQLFSKLAQSKTPLSSDELCKIGKGISRNFYMDELHSKLALFEAKTWDEIEKETYGTKNGNKSKHHCIKVKDLSQDAKKRLKELQQDDIDEVFSLRLEGELRVIGIRKLNCLSILWIDREHEVCISNKKHT